MNHSPWLSRLGTEPGEDPMRGFFGGPADLGAGEPLEIGNHISFLYFTSNANIDTKIGTKLTKTLTNHRATWRAPVIISIIFFVTNNQEKIRMLKGIFPLWSICRLIQSFMCFLFPFCWHVLSNSETFLYTLLYQPTLVPTTMLSFGTTKDQPTKRQFTTLVKTRQIYLCELIINKAFSHRQRNKLSVRGDYSKRFINSISLSSNDADTVTLL